MKITEEDIALLTHFIGADSSISEFVAFYDHRVEIIIRIITILNQIIDSGKIPSVLKEPLYEAFEDQPEIKDIERKKQQIIEDLEDEFGVKLKNRVPKLYQELADPSTRVFDTSSASDYLPRIFDRERQEIKVGSRVEYAGLKEGGNWSPLDEYCLDSKKGLVKLIQEKSFLDGEDKAVIDVQFDGEKYDTRAIVLWNQPIEELFLIDKEPETLKAISLLRDVRGMKHEKPSLCLEKFLGAVVVSVSPFKGKMGAGLRVVVRIEEKHHSIDFLNRSGQHGAMVYKEMCEYPFLPVEQGKTLAETVRKTIIKWGIVNPDNVPI